MMLLLLVLLVVLLVLLAVMLLLLSVILRRGSVAMATRPTADDCQWFHVLQVDGMIQSATLDKRLGQVRPGPGVNADICRVLQPRKWSVTMATLF